MINFTPLNLISGYTFLSSGLTIKKIIDSIKKNNFFGAGLSDYNCLFGLHEFDKKMREINKPSCLGMRIEVNGDNLVLYIKNEEGYRNLLAINASIQKEELTFEVINKHSEGLLAILETKYGNFKSLLIESDTKLGKYLVSNYSSFKDDLFLGIDIASKEDINYASKVREFASSHLYKTVAFPRIKYQKKEDAIVIDILNAIKDETVQLEDKSKVGYECFLTNENYNRLYTVDELLLAQEIVKQNSFKLDIKRGSLLKISDNDIDLLKSTCKQKLIDKGLLNQDYSSRLEYELDVIIKMGFSSYFLLVSDYVNYAKKEGIVVGPGRGSASSSLVAYLLDITEVDPIKYSLTFERFLNPNRQTLPDIDVDFMDIRRDEVVDYIRNKYGVNKVANIVTFQRILAKQALRDIQRVYKYPVNHIDKLCKSLPVEGKDNKDLTLRDAYIKGGAFKALVDSDKYFLEIVSLASKIEGLPRQAGSHAAGIIINETPLEESLPISIDISNNYTSQYEMEYLEKEGFLKMDFLSLRNLTTLDLAVKLINKNHNLELKVNSIPFDDKKVYELLNQGFTMGIFQLESKGMQRAIKIIKPNCFLDVIALLALFRPGPMDSIKEYAARKENKKPITYISKNLEPVLSSTYGIIIYQEQINEIAILMAGFSKGEADIFRRAISKKDKDKILDSENKFIEGSVSNGYTKKEAKEVFDLIVKFANYGFNKAHSVAYSIIALRLAYLKVYYPIEFYSAILETTTANYDSKLNEYIIEMKQRNIKIYPSNINKSSLMFERFLIDGLLFPLNAIKGINLAMNQEIILERTTNGEFVDFYDFVLRMFERGIKEFQVLALIDSGALDTLCSSRATMRLSLKGAIQFAMLVHNDDGQLSMGILESLKPKMSECEDDVIYNLNQEYESLGIMLSDNPISYKKRNITDKTFVDILSLPINKECQIIGLIKTKKTISTKKNESMAYISIIDESGEIEVTIFPKVYQECYLYLEKNNIVIITGRLENHDIDASFIANKIEPLEN